MSDFYSLITNYQGIKEIVNNETRRLEQKKENINNAYQNQQRVIQLNQSYGERMQAYSMIILVIILVVIVSTVAFYLKPYIGDTLHMLLIIIIVFLAVGYIFYLYVGIQARDRVIYSKLALNAPNNKKDSTGAAGSNVKPAGDLLSLTGLPYGKCGDGNGWDNSDGTCRCPIPNIYIGNNRQASCIIPPQQPPVVIGRQ